MCLAKGAGTDGDILDTHLMYFFHDHIYDIVTFTEMVMEA